MRTKTSILEPLSAVDNLNLYTQMVRMRRIEERAEQLFRENRTVGRVYTGRGQEAISVGAAYALNPDDGLAPLYREMGAHLVRGVTPREIFCQYMGRKNSATQGRDSGLHIGDPHRHLVSMISSLTASLPVAVGMGLSYQIRGQQRVAMTFLGDGATSTGSAHEGLNFAATRKIPVVFVCSNNQWSLSTPSHQQHGLARLAGRGTGYGMASVQVDGNDVRAVYYAAAEAVVRARHGKGPTFIEAVTMRMAGHSVTDPAVYIPKTMTQQWQEKDPLHCFQTQLCAEGLLTAEKIEQIELEIREEIDDAVRFAEESPLMPTDELTTGVFAEFHGSTNAKN